MKKERVSNIEQLKALKLQFKACWVRGEKWRLEVGKLFCEIKLLCLHGQWGEFLNEYNIARSTADDYVQRYVEENGITAPREIGEREPDPEAEQRKKDLAAEKNKRKGKKPMRNPNVLHVRLPKLKRQQIELYYQLKKADQERVMTYWYAAFTQILKEVTTKKPAKPAVKSTATRKTVPAFVAKSPKLTILAETEATCAS